MTIVQDIRARYGSTVADLDGVGIRQRLFPSHLELVPQLNEVYELELAFYESQILSDDEIVHNGAYFARVGERLPRPRPSCSREGSTVRSQGNCQHDR